MQKLFIIFILLSFSTFSWAEETPKPYTEMTLVELQQVDTASLDKKTAKTYKKALKAAKKAEKKRLKAKAKAEKAQLKAEKKRLKAEAKARKKHNKPILKQLALIDTTYAKTLVRKDDFEAYVGTTAQPHTDNYILFGLDVNTTDQWYRLRSYFYESELRLVLQLYLSKKLVVQELTSQDVEYMSGPPEKYVTRNGYWKNYSRVTLRGGISKETTPVERYFASCSYECNFREDIAITLDLKDFIKPLDHGQNLEMKVSNKVGASFIVTVPPGYIIGYLKRLSEINSNLGMLATAAAEGQKVLEGKLLP